jgi:hypothetical protein
MLLLPLPRGVPSLAFVLTAWLSGCGSSGTATTAATDATSDTSADTQADTIDVAGGTPQVGVPSGPVALADLVQAIAAAHCHRLVDCDAPVAGLYNVAVPAHCPAFLAGFSFYDATPFVALAQAGTLAYDPALGGACVSELAACTNQAKTPDSCQKMFAGTLDAGKACSQGVTCKSGACVPTPSSAPCTPGTCVAAVQVGQPCGSGAPCETGLTCTGTCTAPVAAARLGEACAGTGCQGMLICQSATDGKQTCQPAGGVDAACKGGQDCQPGLFCSREPPTYGKCRALGKSGEACEYQNELSTCTTGVCGIVFAPGSSKPTFRCLPWGKPGDPCAAMNQCKGTFDAVCKPNGAQGTCVLRGEVGAACTPTDPTDVLASECLFELQCDAATHKCAPLPQAGEPCSKTCAKDAHCDGTSGHCVANPGLNAACDPNVSNCATGLMCDGGKCVKAGCD